ncbi:unnamed protein product [Meloidogyne enterolobii]|uniref:Uncharacterized protein n=1 Tax=Meloidogyne enterolobii TaxID=390850 RepID=A0ACB0ZQV1_MELEN
MIGGAYSLVLEMPTFGRWDVLVESCTCNGIFQFLQGGGCFRRDNFWLNKNEWRSETNKYIVVHFVAPQTLLKFDCQTLVVKCCGCCDNACGRLPLLESFSSLAMTISCQYPLPIPPSPPLLPPPVLPPSTGEYSSGCWMPFLWGDSCPSNGDNDSFWLIPLFLCLLALLLILCCLLGLCIYWAIRRRKEQGRIFPQKKEESPQLSPIPPPIPSPPLPPLPKDRKIFSTDQSAQTTPISPLSPINESGIDYFDKSRRNQRLIDSGNGFERFEHHAALPIIPTSPWFSWSREEEEIEEREEEWRMEDKEGRNKFSRQSFNPPPPYREGNRQQQYYENFGGRANVVGTNLEEEGFRQKINGRNGSTKFGVEKQIDTDEEDRMQIRSVSPKGTIRELDERSRWKRTLF